MSSTYRPREKAVADLLDFAWTHVRSVGYTVTARWLFYRLLQGGHLSTKADYKRFLGYLSKARKRFYKGWRPWTLADDTRSAYLSSRRGWYNLSLRGGGFATPAEWREALATEANCVLERWAGQSVYVEAWFEASAMQSQFVHHVNENVPLLSFKGDISIPAKWAAAQRLYERWKLLDRPELQVLYFGDLDAKGLMIPESARADVEAFLVRLVDMDPEANGTRQAELLMDSWSFRRVGLTPDQVRDYRVPANPERPGSYQWEAIPDAAAAEIISQVDDYLDLGAFGLVEAVEDAATGEMQEALAGLGNG